MSERPAALEDALGYEFRDPRLLRQALTHASAGEGRAGAVSNERLEFLGDRVLGLVIASRLIRMFPEAGEDGLAPRLNALVNKQACARAARLAGLGPALRLSAGEERAGGRDKEAILADACEAVIAAIYLDGGLPAAQAFIERWWEDAFAGVATPPQDPKTALQEWAARAHRDAPVYDLVGRSGPDHAPRFSVAVRVAGRCAQGEGPSKREAERAAARALLVQEGVDV
jgi:ribonuclease-3